MVIAKQTYHSLVFIGRFQIFHNGHLQIVKEALQQTSRLIILVGSVNMPRTARNPFTFEERKEMILQSLTAEEKQQLKILPLEDSLYNDAKWICNVQQLITENSLGVEIGLIGHRQKNTSFFHRQFPDLQTVEASHIEGVNSALLRKMFLEENLPTCVPNAVYQILSNFLTTEHYKKIQEDYLFVKKYAKGWEQAPYMPVFITVDSLVIQSGYLLLMERRSCPGKGLWSLPGGFLQREETVLECALNYLKHEIRLKIPVAVLKGSHRASRVFDDPHRSTKGRAISHTLMFALHNEVSLPKIKGKGTKVFWAKLSDISRTKMFDDHYDIIQNMLSLL